MAPASKDDRDLSLVPLDDQSTYLPLSQEEHGREISRMRKEDILQALVNADDATSLWVLGEFAKNRLPCWNKAVARVAVNQSSAKKSAGGGGKRLEKRKSTLDKLEASWNVLIPNEGKNVLDGSWIGDPVKELVKRISGNNLTWQDGMVTKIRYVTSRQVEMEYGSPPKTYTGDLKQDGRLHWTDGDVWSRYEAVADAVKPIVMFSEGCLGVDEGTPKMSIDIYRVGNTRLRSEVHFATQDNSAVAGTIYKKTEGTVIFEPGELQKTIEVGMIQNTTWDTTLEFTLHLQESGLVNAVLDRYLHECRVKVFNDDPFPNSDNKDALEELRSEDVPMLDLLKAFVEAMIRLPHVWHRTLKFAAVDQLHNVRLAIGLFMNVYLFDRILDLSYDEEDCFMQSRLASLILVVSLQIITFLTLHLVDMLRAEKWGIGGPGIGFLQLSILRQYFYCQETHRGKLGFTGVLTLMTEDATEAVAGLYMRFLGVIMNVGELLVLILFQCLAPIVFNKVFAPFPLVVMCLYPLCMVIFLNIRRDKTVRTLMNMVAKHVAFCKHVDQTSENFQMITSYEMQGSVETEFETCVAGRNAGLAVVKALMLSNSYFASWLAVLATAGYTVCGGLSVIHGVTSLGFLLTNLQLFSQMGASWMHIFEHLTAIQAAFPALQRITNFLNTTTDNEGVAKTHNRAEQYTEQFLSDTIIDERPIVVQGFGSYLGLDTIGNKIDDTELQLPQGLMIALTSPRGGGKSTLLKLIGGMIYPTNTQTCIVVPTHLRVLYLGNAPLFFRGSLMDNLAFGVVKGHQDGSMGRIVDICKDVGLDSSVIALLENQDSTVDWSDRMPASTRHLLNVVRALVANPDVLCMEKPIGKLDVLSGSSLLQELKKMVKQKGLYPSVPLSRRRPRTVIFTTDNLMALEAVDMMLYVDRTSGVRCCKLDALCQEHLQYGVINTQPRLQ